jgi:phosphinothricin acetyltransferase
MKGNMGLMRGIRITLSLALLAGFTVASAAQDRRDEQFYYPGSFNWQFLERYPEAGRLFNAFDYGHAVLYEKLYTRPPDLQRELERHQFDYLTQDLLPRPPRFAVAEEAIEPSYARLAWRAKLMFDWAHMLHRQIYDVYADPRLSRPAQDSLIERVTDYYLSNRRLAFAAVPKSMELMDGQYYSQVFRRAYPKFNGLIWAYHWLQVGLYEPLIEGRTPAERKAGVQATLARFWTMLHEPPAGFPRVMPMTATIAPRFSAAHPRAAAIFDNLHMTHDIISDILAADTVPRSRKREVIYAALDAMQDSTRDVMTAAEWRDMGEMMGGAAAMGGPATGLLQPPPDAGPGDHRMPPPGMHDGGAHGVARPAPPDSTRTAPAHDHRPGLAPRPRGRYRFRGLPPAERTARGRVPHGKGRDRMAVVRPARAGDAGQVAAIYNQGIRSRAATFETRERAAADIAGWFTETYPFLVAEGPDGAVTGWVRASAYRPRECYAGIAEFSIYVAEAMRGRRMGDALMAAFLPACATAGFWKVLSRIFPENTASRALCARHGFREVGVYHKHARLDGHWRDVVIVERLIEENF